MSYTINKTDGSLLTEIIDSAIDRTATDLVLIGKNVTGYGEFINENFVKLLENFASTSEPSNPIAGQLWYDQTDNRLKVYDGNGFAIAAGPLVSGTPPLTPNQGDFWIDNKEKQLYFYDGTRSRFLAGKMWSDAQGKSGFEINTVSDTFGNRRTVTYLWNAGNLLGIFSNHVEFTPSSVITGIPVIKTGFTVSSNVTNFKLHAKAESAEFLENSQGDLISAEDFLTFNQPNNLTETLAISNSLPLILGTGAEVSVLVGSGLTEIRNQIGQDFKITTLDNSVPLFYIKSSSNRVGIFNNNPQAELDVSGSVIISGDLTVNGATTTISTTNLNIADKNLIIADGATSDTDADGGGLTLKGLTDKTFNWVNDTSSWTSSENLDIDFGKVYKINGNEILSDNSLASSVTSALGLNYVGKLDSLQVGRISNPSFFMTIEDGGINTSTGLTLTLDSGTSVINVSNKRLTNVADPIGSGDAVNKSYLESVASKSWVLVGLPSAPELLFSSNNDRLQIDTQSASATVCLPDFATPGSNVRFIDYNGAFAINPLIITRFRKVNWNDSEVPNHGESSATTIGTFVNLATETDGTGTGLILTIETTQLSASYLETNTFITVVNPGVGYRTGDSIIVKGSTLGGIDGSNPGNDFIFRLNMDQLLGEDNDLTVSTPSSAFNLVFTSPSQGWQYTEFANLPTLIFADLQGSVTGNVIGNVSGNVVGDVTGNVSGNLAGNVSGCQTLTSNDGLSIQSFNDDIKIISGKNGLLLTAFDNSATQNQYVMQVIPAPLAGQPSTTLLFGNVVVSNQTSPSSAGGSFKLPVYTIVERDLRVLTSDNYGEIIYNTDTNKIQAYVAPNDWVDLH